MCCRQGGRRCSQHVCRAATSAQRQSDAESQPLSNDSYAAAAGILSRRDVGVRTLAIGLAATLAADAAALLQAPAAAAEALTVKDVTPPITPAGPLSARSVCCCRAVHVGQAWPLPASSLAVSSLVHCVHPLMLLKLHMQGGGDHQHLRAKHLFGGQHYRCDANGEAWQRQPTL